MNETNQDRDDREASEWHAAMLEIQREATDALQASLVRPLTPDEVAALAWVAHIPYPQEKHA